VEGRGVMEEFGAVYPAAGSFMRRSVYLTAEEPDTARYEPDGRPELTNFVFVSSVRVSILMVGKRPLSLS